MKKHKNTLLIAAFTFLSLFLLYISFSVYYEAYEYFFNAAFEGYITDNKPVNIAIYTYIGIGSIIKYLNSLFPEFPWYTIIMCSLTTIGLFQIQLLFLSKQFSSSTRVHCFLFGLIFLILSESLFLFQFTRVAFILSISSLLFACFTSFNWKSLIFSLSVFCLGILVRPEVAFLMLLLCFPLFFLVNESFKKSSFFIILFIFAILTIQNDRNSSNEFYKKVLHSKTEYQIALGNVVPIGKMKTSEDSMKYTAVCNGIVNDPDYISYQFMRQIVADNSIVLLSKTLFARSLTELNKCATNYSHLIVLCILLLSFNFIIHRKNKKKSIFLFSYSVYLGSVLLYISYNMSMERRVMGPILSFFAITNIIILLEGDILNKIRHQKQLGFIFGSLFLLWCFWCLLFIYNLSNSYNVRIVANKKTLGELEKIAANKILVPESSAFVSLFFDNQKPFDNPKFPSFKKLFLMDIEMFSLTPDYNTFLNKNCNCNSSDLAVFYDYLYSIKDDVILAGNEERIKVYEKYLRIVRKRNYIFKKTGQISGTETTGYKDISTFVITKDSL